MKTSFLILSLVMLTVNMIHVLSEGQKTLYIACGRTDSVTDNDGNTWVGDFPTYIQSGEGQVLQTSSVAPFLRSVRYFRQGGPNCYSIQLPDLSAQGQINVTAFFYGNNDGEHKAPTFLLQIEDGDEFTDETATGLLTTYSRAWTYTSIQNPFNNLCLRQDGTEGVLFISAIEIIYTSTSSKGTKSFTVCGNGKEGVLNFLVILCLSISLFAW